MSEWCGQNPAPRELLTHLLPPVTTPQEDITWQRLSRLTALTRLDLSWCRVERLPPQLTKLQSLADLSLSGSCYLGTWGAESALLLEQLTALTRLDASMCEFHAVPAIFAAIPGLRALHLAKNPKLGRCVRA